MNKIDAMLTALDAYRRIEQINQMRWVWRFLYLDELQKLRNKVLRCWVIIENFTELETLDAIKKEQQ